MFASARSAKGVLLNMLTGVATELPRQDVALCAAGRSATLSDIVVDIFRTIVGTPLALSIGQ